MQTRSRIYRERGEGRGLKDVDGNPKDEDANSADEEDNKVEDEGKSEGNGLSQNGPRAKGGKKQTRAGRGEEVRRTTTNPEVYKPSKAEKEQHERTHCPFRIWCKHCVRGRGMNAQHRKKNMKTQQDSG